MALRFNTKDRRILSLIAEHGILTVTQIAALTRRSRQVVRRRMRFFISEGLIMTRMRGYGRGPGRPEDIIFFTEKGVMFCRNEGIISDQVTCITEKTIEALPINHCLLVNWFHIHSLEIERAISKLSVHYLSSNLTSLERNEHNESIPNLHIRMENEAGETFQFIPDAVFSIRNEKIEKELLFFLEVDMGTEPISSRLPNSNDIRQKILNYQALFRSGHYKTFEEIFEAKFNGFRLLFLVNSAARLASLSRLVQEMPPSDFIWLTNQEKMFSDGLSAEIWVRGGKTDSPQQSIIGPDLAIQTAVMDRTTKF